MRELLKVIVVHERMGIGKPLGLLWKKIILLKVLYIKGTHYSKSAICRSTGLAQNRIDPSIQQLKENGFILEEKWKQNGRGKQRDNLVYKITAKGKNVLDKWVALTEALEIE